MNAKKRNATYYQIRAEWVWSGVLCLVLLCGVEILQYQLLTEQKEPPPAEDQLRVEITYEDWRSELADPGQCLLCGEAASRQMEPWQKSGTIGLILLNDWTVLDFPLTESPPEDGRGTGSDPGVRYRNTPEAACLSSGDPSRGMARMEVSWSGDLTLNPEFLQRNLCSSCLSQAAGALSFFKGEQEEKDALPLCLIDFQTRELYPVQDTYRAYFIRDYWVEMDFAESSVTIKAYDLPKKDRPSG